MRLRYSIRGMILTMAILGVMAAGIGAWLRSRVLFHVVAEPGTQVYIDDHFLGHAPVAVTCDRFKALGYRWQPNLEDGRATPSPECGVVFLHIRRSDGTSPLIWFKTTDDDEHIECHTPWGTGKAILTSDVSNGRLVATFQDRRSRWDQGGWYAGGSRSVGGASLVVTRLPDQLEVRLLLPISEERCTTLTRDGAVVFLAFRSISSDKWVNIDIPVRDVKIGQADDMNMLLTSRVDVPPRKGVYYPRACLLDAKGRSIQNLPEVIASGCVELQK